MKLSRNKPSSFKVDDYVTIKIDKVDKTPLEVRAFGPQFYRVPAYSQASALLLQKLL